MPIATLQFNLPEENSEFQLTTHASDLSSALYELSEYLRGKTKYPNIDTPSEVTETYQAIFDKFNDVLTDNNVSSIIYN